MAPEWAPLPTTSDGRADRLKGFARLFEVAPFVGHKWGLGVLRRRLKYKEIKCCKAFRGCHRLVYCPKLTKKGENYGSRKQEKNQYLYG